MAKLISEKVLIFQVPEGQKKERIDIYLTNKIENATRSKIQKMIREGYALVDGKPVKPNYLVSPGIEIKAVIPVSPRPEFAEPEEIPLEIVYEDDYIIIINKPPGMVVHPAYGNYTGTLVNALLHHSSKLSSVNDAGRPGIIHRIDKETSGLLITAKDDYTHAMLAKQFANHTVEREYNAVVWGNFDEKEGEVIGNISRSPKDRKLFTVSQTSGKHAHTFYKVKEEFEFASLISLRLKTGRTHQIRVHMAYKNHPVFGDPSYGGRKIVYGSSLPKMKNHVENLLKIMPRQALHAKTLGFVHPATKEFIRFDSELPEDMKELLAILRGN